MSVGTAPSRLLRGVGGPGEDVVAAVYFRTRRLNATQLWWLRRLPHHPRQSEVALSPISGRRRPSIKLACPEGTPARTL